MVLGDLAAMHGVTVSDPPETRIDDQSVAYNQHKVVWVDDLGGSGHRPMIPLDYLLERENVTDESAAESLVHAIKHEANRALEAGEHIPLLDFVHAEPAPSEWFQYDVQGIYADRALELAYGGVVLERLPGIGPPRIIVATFRNFCADLVMPSEH